MIWSRGKEDWHKTKPGTLCCKYLRLWNIFIRKRSSTETSSLEICFWLKTCRSRWETLDLPPRFRSLDKKGELSAALQITLHPKFCNPKVTATKSTCGVLEWLCTLWYMVVHLSNRKMWSKHTKKLSQGYFHFLITWMYLNRWRTWL